jgi:6-pyruvoyltetrahydropterin/6-carboxytetrahydropterin synthase
MFEVGVVAQFEAAHQLRGDFGPAARVHGHTYRVEVAARGSKLAADGTLYDIGALRRALGLVTGRLDYQNLDEVEGLRDENTTAETVARYIWTSLVAELESAGLQTLAVRVWESSQVWAAYEGPLPPA